MIEYLKLSRHNWHIKPWLVIGLIAALLTGVLSTQAFAVSSGSIGGRPAHPREDNPRTKSIFVHTLNFGQSAEEGLLVVNNSDTTQTVNLYAVDASVTSSGSLTCRQRVEEKKDAGNWITLSQSSVTLEPGKDQIIPFTISVPKQSADVGEHNACMVIEPVVDEQNDPSSGGVKIRTRSAIRIAVTIPGDLKKSLDFANFAIRSDKSNYNFDVSVKNDGNVSLDADIKVRLSSVFGKTVYSNSGQYPVIAKTQLDLTFTSEHLPMFGGWYWVDASVGYDKSIKNELGDKTDQELVTKNWERQLVFISPSVGGLLIIIAAALFFISVPAYLMYRARRRHQIIKSGSQHVVNSGETIRTIADQHGVSWKKLASLNKIKAPYDLELKSTLTVPKKNPKSPKIKPRKSE